MFIWGSNPHPSARSCRGVAQLVAHTAGGREVASSSLVTPTIQSLFSISRFTKSVRLLNLRLCASKEAFKSCHPDQVGIIANSKHYQISKITELATLRQQRSLQVLSPRPRAYRKWYFLVTNISGDCSQFSSLKCMIALVEVAMVDALHEDFSTIGLIGQRPT